MILDRIAGALGYERRSIARNGWPTGGPVASSGHAVNHRVAENLSTVLACTNAIASVLSSLPAYVYRQLERGRAEDQAHLVAALVAAPNDFQTWPDWIEFRLAQAILRSNALSVIEYDGAGRPTALVPIPLENVQAYLLPSGRLAYDVVRYVGIVGGTGQTRRYLDQEVFHLKDRSDNGILGSSRLSRAPEVLGNALALQEHSGAMWRNGATPSGALQIEGKMTEDQFKRLRAQFSQGHTGTSNSGKVLILDNNAKCTSISVSPEDAEVLASRRFSVEELCRVYQVPPPIIQDLSHGTFTNSREAGRWFAQFSLAPWARKIEAEFSRSVFTGDGKRSHHLEIDLSALTRGSFEKRWQAHKIAVEAGILDPDEVREQEGYNPRGAQAEGEVNG